MKVILMVWLIGAWGPTMPVPVETYIDNDAHMKCQMALDRWTINNAAKGMCLRVWESKS